MRHLPSLGGPPYNDRNGGGHSMHPEGQLGRGPGLSFNDPNAPRGAGQGGNQMPSRGSGRPHTDLQTANYIYPNMHPNQSTPMFHIPGAREGSGSPFYGSHYGGNGIAQPAGQVSATGGGAYSNANYQHGLSALRPSKGDRIGRPRNEGFDMQQSGGQASGAGGLSSSRGHYGGLVPVNNLSAPISDTSRTSRPSMPFALHNSSDNSSSPNMANLPGSNNDHSALPNGHRAPVNDFGQILIGNTDISTDGTNTDVSSDIRWADSSSFGGHHDAPVTPAVNQSQEPASIGSTVAMAHHHNHQLSIAGAITQPITQTPASLNYFPPAQLFPPIQISGGVLADVPTGVVPPAVPAGFLAGGIPAGGVPAVSTGGVPAGGVPAGGVPAGGVPAGGVPAGGVPAVQAGAPAGGTGNAGGFLAGWAPAPDRNQVVVCAVCGGVCKTTNNLDIIRTTPDWMLPLLVRAKPDYLEWLKTRNVLPRRLSITDAMDQIPVTKFLGGHQGMESGAAKLRINTKEPLMNIPVHEACLCIADRFCRGQARYEVEFRNSNGGAPSNIWHLYEIWCKRAIATCPKGLMSSPILEANMYFGAPAPTFVTMDKYRAAMEAEPSHDRFLACPLDIPYLTTMLVESKLQTMDGKDAVMRSDLAEVWGRLHGMPQEIFDRVLGALEPFDAEGGPPLEPTRVLPGTWWKKKLFSGTLIPWLWDLNEEDLTRYRIRTFYKHNPSRAREDERNGAYIFDENMWDWEYLCRQLAQPDILEENDFWGGMSKQIWNRRRIWKLLDAARLGHVLFRLPPKRN